MTFSGIAHAATAWAQDGAGGAGSFLSPGNPLFLMMAMFAILYFLLIRPQQKKQKDMKAMLSNLQKGDMVYTVGGIHGKITGLSDGVITIEIADRVRVKINRGSIGGLLSKAEVAEKEKESEKE